MKKKPAKKRVDMSKALGATRSFPVAKRRQGGPLEWLGILEEVRARPEDRDTASSSPSATIQVKLPHAAFAAMQRGPNELAPELRLAASIHWYQQGKISLAIAAEIAGMNKPDFLKEVALRKVDLFRVDGRDPKREVSRG